MTKLDLSLAPQEIDEYLRTQRTTRLATVGPDGSPHAVPFWFVWLGDALYVNTTRANVTVRNLERHPRATACIDDGETYDTLRGVLLYGVVEPAGDDPSIPDVEHLWSEKYLAGNPVPFQSWKNRIWLRLEPDRTTSWDFRKIPEARARATRG